MIGREKNPGESEVARLIEQSIAEDKRRDDMRQRQQEAARQVCVLYVRYLRLFCLQACTLYVQPLSPHFPNSRLAKL